MDVLPEFSYLLIEELGKVAFFKLNRPDALNSINKEMAESIILALDYYARRDDIVAIVFEGEGRAFCAGGDVVSIYHSGKQGAPDFHFFEEEYLLNLAIDNFCKPLISIWDGIVMGGGVGLSVYGKYRIATQNTIFSMPEVMIGFFPDIGAAYFFQNFSMAIRQYLSLTAAKIYAGDCLNLNLATHAIDANNIGDFKQSLVSALAECIEYHTGIEREVCQKIDLILSKYKLAHPASALNPEIMNVINDCFSAKSVSVEDIIEKLHNNRQQNADIIDKMLDAMNSASPLSLKITFQHLHRCDGETLAYVLNEDYRIMHHMLNSYDFYEGVRALLVDKDKKPQWQFDSLAKITHDIVENYFSPVGYELL